jgi:hypothetical protein
MTGFRSDRSTYDRTATNEDLARKAIGGFHVNHRPPKHRPLDAVNQTQNARRKARITLAKVWVAK